MHLKATIYPSFNSGVGNILSADLVKYIATNRHLLRPLSNEDVTIGTWLSTLNVKPTHDTRFQAHTGMCFEDMVTKHPVTPTEMTMFYDRVNARVPLCTNVESYACPYGRVCQEQQVSWTQGLTCDETGCAPVARSESTNEAEAARARMLLASVSSIPASDSPASSLASSVPSVSQLDVFCAPAAHQEVKPFLDGNLAVNPGFETFVDNVAVGWDNFYDGYTLDKKLESSPPLHSFKKSATCLFLSSNSFNGEQAYGATQIVKVEQELPLPILLTGWARTQNIVHGPEALPQDISIYISESDDWQFYTKLYYPSKPVKEVSLSVLFSRTKGNIWFDDIQILSLDSKKSLCAASYVVRSVPELTLPTIVRYEGEQMISVFPNPLSCSAMGPRYDLQQIASKMPGEEWLNDIDKWKMGQHFYAHSSDFLRFLLLYRFGGIYSDFDSVMVQPLPLSKLSTDFIGVEWCEAEGLSWCVAIKDSTFVETPKQPKITPPSNTFSFSIGLMGFSLGSSFLKEILLRFVTDYSQTRWGCGTVLASMAYKQNPDTYKVAIVPPHLFYPIGYQDIVQYFSEDDTTLWNDIKQNSYAFHLFGKVSGKEKVKKDSLVSKALSDFVLLKYT